MRFIDEFEVKTDFYRVLEAVERGETFVIRRKGRSIARMEPVAESGEEANREGADGSYLHTEPSQS